MKHVTNTLTANIEQKLFWGLSFMVLASAGLYIYFISTSIVHVLVREETELDIAKMSTEVSTLEAHYLRTKTAIDEELALAQGFTITNPTHFVTRGSRSLTFNQ